MNPLKVSYARALDEKEGVREVNAAMVDTSSKRLNLNLETDDLCKDLITIDMLGTKSILKAYQLIKPVMRDLYKTLAKK